MASLLLVFFCIGGCLFCIHVEFFSIVFLVIYAGAILVVFLFATALLNFRENIRGFVDYNFLYILFIFFWLLLYLKVYYFLNSIEKCFSLEYALCNSFEKQYIFQFCIDDMMVFMGLYACYGFLLILFGLALLVVLLGTVGLCMANDYKN